MSPKISFFFMGSAERCLIQHLLKIQLLVAASGDFDFLMMVTFCRAKNATGYKSITMAGSNSRELLPKTKPLKCLINSNSSKRKWMRKIEQLKKHYYHYKYNTSNLRWFFVRCLCCCRLAIPFREIIKKTISIECCQCSSSYAPLDICS